MRRRLYTEHKYVTHRLCEFGRLLAKADFANDGGIQAATAGLQEIKDLLTGHAEHENAKIHRLLQQRQSTVHAAIEMEHAKHQASFEKMESILSMLQAERQSSAKIELGEQLYRTFQEFEAKNALHQVAEETRILPELYRLYSDEEILKGVDGPVYEEMGVDDMAGMIQTLAPHFNIHDSTGMLRDIYMTRPEKFHALWPLVKDCFNIPDQAGMFNAIIGRQ